LFGYRLSANTLMMAETASDHLCHQTAPYVQAIPYSDKRLFEGPRVQVPPPSLDYRNGRPSFHVPGNPYDQTSHEYGNPVFLRALNACHELAMNHMMLSWHYEMRRTAQPILQFLFLGPSNPAKDIDFIKKNGITLMVAVRSSKAVQARPTFLEPRAFPSSAGLATMTVDFEYPHDFMPKLRPTIRAINNHLESSCTRLPIEDINDVRGKVLVFCESGNDRSPVLVAAYLMCVFGVTAFSAIHIIQSQRFCITMSDEMKNMLLGLQEIIKAERQVSVSNSTSQLPAGQRNKEEHLTSLRRPAKRNVDDVYEGDLDNGHGPSDGEDVDVREGVAPFADMFD